MQNTEIQLNKKRDFSEVINATFTFLKQEFKPLAKVILWYAGIPIIISSIIGAFYSGSEITKMFQQIQGDIVSSGVVSSPRLFSLMMLSSIFVYIFLTGLTASYVNLYITKGKGEFTSADVWNEFAPFIGPLIGLNILMFLMILISGAIGGFFVIGLSSLASSGVFTAIIIFIGMIALVIVPLFYLMTPLSLAFMPLFHEKSGVVAAIKRSFSLVFGNWWVTFGVIIIATIIVSLLGTLFSIPALIVGFVQGYVTVTNNTAMDSTSFAVIFTTVIASVAQFIIYPIIFIAIAIQYFNLKEQKENPELLKKIAEINEE